MFYHFLVPKDDKNVTEEVKSKDNPEQTNESLPVNPGLPVVKKVSQASKPNILLKMKMKPQNESPQKNQNDVKSEEEKTDNLPKDNLEPQSKRFS